VKRTAFTVLLLVSAAAACGGSQRGRGDGRPDELEGGNEADNREARALRGSCERGGREVTYDLDHDGTTDIREVYDDDRIVCRETDLNFDGRVDVYRYFEEGRQRREEMDLDRDGRLDLVGIFDQAGQNIVREEYDTNYDSRIDVWRFFAGQDVQRVERDSDADGRADVWTHCQSGRAQRIEYDSNGDGQPDDTQNVGDEETESECARGVLAETASPAAEEAPEESQGSGEADDGEEG
jgi:hypothetical protein